MNVVRDSWGKISPDMLRGKSGSVILKIEWEPWFHLHLSCFSGSSAAYTGHVQSGLVSAGLVCLSVVSVWLPLSQSHCHLQTNSLWNSVGLL